MDLLKLAVICIDFLAWPVIALGYPLFASIKAVETGSKYHMRKLVIYWTIFALISLFEFAFVKIIEWIPFWSRLRLVAIFWLVMPQFDGACHAYDSLVRHVLLVNLQAVIDKLYRRKEEKLSKRATFLDVGEQYIKENGSEALEKLIVSKAMQHECKDCNNFPGDIQVLEPEEKNAVQTLKLPKEPDAALHHGGTLEAPNSAATETKWGAETTAKVKETTPPLGIDVRNRSLETPPLKKTQQRIEWTCDLCKVTMTNEKTLNTHLQGRKHKSNCESLRASMIRGVNEKTSPAERSSQNCCPVTPTINKVQQEWTCDLCNVKTTCKKNLNDHLQGSKHKSKCELLKANELNAKDTGPSPFVIGKLNQGNFDLETNLAAPMVKESTPTKGSAENSCLETPMTKKVQEWTCDLCNVKTNSEKTLNDHLEGSKHKLLEFLKDNDLKAKDTGHSPSATCKLNLCNMDFGTCITTAEVKESIPPETSAENSCSETPMEKKVQQERTRELLEVKITCEKMLSDHLQGSKYKSDAGPSSSAISKLSQSNIDFGTDAAAAKVKESTPPEGSGENCSPEITPIKEVQQVWTYLCNVKTSEKTLNDHIKGREHKSKCESLKANKLKAKDTGPLSSATDKLKKGNMDFGIESEDAKVKEKTTTEESVENIHSEIPTIKKVPEWACDLCNVKTTSEETLYYHFQGNKHRSKREFLKASKCNANDRGPSSATTKLNQGNVETVESKVGKISFKNDPERAHFQVPKDQQKLTKMKKDGGANRIFKQFCDVCDVKLLSDIDLVSHVKGKRHRSNIQEMENLEGHEFKECDNSERDIQVVEPVLTNVVATSKQLKELDVSQTDSGTLEATKRSAPSEVKRLQVQYAPPKPAAWVPKGTEAAAAKVKEPIPAEANIENRWPVSPPIKRVQLKEPDVAQHDYETLEATKKSAAVEVKWVQTVQYVHSKTTAWVPKGTEAGTTKVKDTPSHEAIAEQRLLETPPIKKVQQERTFDLCKLKTTSENLLNAHLQGSKHNFMFGSLKASKLDSERDVQAVLPEDKNAAATLKQVHNVQSKTTASAWVPKGSEAAAAKAKDAAPPEASAENKQIVWTCDLCRVTNTGEKTLNAHFQGSTHKSNCESLKASKLNAKDTGLSPKGTGKSNHATLEEAGQTSSVKTQEENQFQTKPKQEGAANQIFKRRCVLCDVKLISDIDLAAHLRGKRHMSNIKAMPNLKAVFS